MPKNCISIYDEFSNIGPIRRTWTWGIMSTVCVNVCACALNSVKPMQQLIKIFVLLTLQLDIQCDILSVHFYTDDDMY